MTTTRNHSDRMYRDMSRTLLEQIYSQTTDRQAQRDIMREMDRRDDAGITR